MSLEQVNVPLIAGICAAAFFIFVILLIVCEVFISKDRSEEA